jgi:hypothetical protein
MFGIDSYPRQILRTSKDLLNINATVDTSQEEEKIQYNDFGKVQSRLSLGRSG